MPRQRRVREPGFVYHVTNRGVGGITLFRDDHDKKVFVEIAATEIERARAVLTAWAVLENHYHKTLYSPEGDLSALIRRIESRYARYFNDSKPRQGYVFQARFHSMFTKSRAKARGWIGYTDANIGDAYGLSLDEVARHRWCSHGASLGLAPPQAGHDVEATLRYFMLDREEDWDRARERLIATTEEQMRRMSARRRILTDEARGIISGIAGEHGVDLDDLLEGGGARGASVVRARIAAVRACRSLGMTDRAVMKAFNLSKRTLQRARARRKG